MWLWEFAHFFRWGVVLIIYTGGKGIKIGHGLIMKCTAEKKSNLTRCYIKFMVSKALFYLKPVFNKTNLKRTIG